MLKIVFNKYNFLKYCHFASMCGVCVCVLIMIMVLWCVCVYVYMSVLGCLSSRGRKSATTIAIRGIYSLVELKKKNENIQYHYQRKTILTSNQVYPIQAKKANKARYIS